MAKRPSSEQIAFVEASLAGNSHDVANLLRANAKPLRHLIKDIDKTIHDLLYGDERAVDKAFERFDSFLDRPAKIPVRRLSLTPLVKKAVVAAQHEIEAEKSRKSRAAKAPIGSFANAWASIMSSWGFDRRERNAIAVGFWSPFIAGAAMNAFGAVSDADAALPPPPAPEPVRNVLEIDVNRFGPTEITVRPSNPFNAVMVQSAFKLMPALERRIKRDPQAAQYVGWMREAAMQCEIDPNLFANQLFKESAWFDEDVISGKDRSNKLAGGIAQWTDKTAAAYGLDKDDIYDPRKAIFAAARYMCDLTKQYGDQQLAMIAYNGGPGAIDFVRRELETKNITITQWMDFMRERRTELGTKDNTLWHNQSFRYIRETSSQFWNTPPVLQTLIKLPDQPPIPFRPT